MCTQQPFPMLACMKSLPHVQQTTKFSSLIPVQLKPIFSPCLLAVLILILRVQNPLCTYKSHIPSCVMYRLPMGHM